MAGRWEKTGRAVLGGADGPSAGAVAAGRRDHGGGAAAARTASGRCRFPIGQLLRLALAAPDGGLKKEEKQRE